MRVEVVFALPEQQVLIAVDVPDGSTVAGAIEESGIREDFPGINFEDLQTGIWGTPTDRGQKLREGDRVEIYRPLALDPREARRLKAGI